MPFLKSPCYTPTPAKNWRKVLWFDLGHFKHTGYYRVQPLLGLIYECENEFIQLFHWFYVYV